MMPLNQYGTAIPNALVLWHRRGALRPSMGPQRFGGEDAGDSEEDTCAPALVALERGARTGGDGDPALLGKSAKRAPGPGDAVGGVRCLSLQAPW